MASILDKHNDVLYCSKYCARKDSARDMDCREIAQEEFEEEREVGEGYGATCHVCDTIYAEWDGDDGN